MPGDSLVSRARRSVESVAPVVRSFCESVDVARIVHAAGERGYFTPDEDFELRKALSGYLTARSALLETIRELRPIALARRGRSADPATQLRAFLVGYCASALLVKAGRYLVNHVAPTTVTRRKLDEPARELGIAPRQFTAVYRSLTRPSNAWLLRSAVEFAEAHRERLDALALETEWAAICEILASCEEALDVPAPRYLKGVLRYRLHSWRWRRRASVSRALFALLEASGRLVATMRDPWYRKRVNRVVRRRLGELLRPGDVIVTRHNNALSNVFLPGFWPHAALFIGPPATRERFAIEVDEDRARRWSSDRCVLEARKDGVLLRPLGETLLVDAVAVIRPDLPEERIARALETALRHEGKLYDFSFDFFRADRLVCTEVVYRAFHGAGVLEFELTPRAGRMTLSAEDLLWKALRNDGFAPVAVFGVPGTRRRVLQGGEAADALSRSLAAR